MDIVEQMRGFESDHEPDGWPAIQMKQVSALCDEIERLQGIIDKANAQEPYGWDSAGDLIFSIDDGVNGVIPVPLYAAPLPAQQSPGAAVQICDECDIADCKHVRNATLQIIVNKSPRITEQDAREIIEAVAHIGVDFGYGAFEIQPEMIAKCRALLNKLNGDQNGK